MPAPIVTRKDVEEALTNYHRPTALGNCRLARLLWLVQPDAKSLGTQAQGALQAALAHYGATHEREMKSLRLMLVDKRPKTESMSALGVERTALYTLRNAALALLEDYFSELVGAALPRYLQEALRHLPQATYFEFVGLGSQLQQITTSLSNDEQHGTHPIVLVGLGGLGKTSLLREALVQWVERDLPPIKSVLWATLERTEFDAADAAVGRLLVQLGHQVRLPLGAEPTLDDKVERLCAYLTQTPHLVVLDNVELPDEVATLAPIVAKLARTARTIVTSRHTFDDPALPQKSLKLTGLPETEALRLLDIEAARLEIADYDEAMGKKIVAQVGGHPQALKLVVAQVGLVPIAQLLAQLSGWQWVEDELLTHNYERAWRCLSESAQWLLLGLGHLPLLGADWATLKLALKGAGLPNDDNTLLGVIRELERLNLLIVHRRTPPSYSLHRLTYHFIEHKQAQIEEDNDDD